MIKHVILKVHALHQCVPCVHDVRLEIDQLLPEGQEHLSVHLGEELVHLLQLIVSDVVVISSLSQLLLNVTNLILQLFKNFYFRLQHFFRGFQLEIFCSLFFIYFTHDIH